MGIWWYLSSAPLRSGPYRGLPLTAHLPNHCDGQHHCSANAWRLEIEQVVGGWLQLRGAFHGSRALALVLLIFESPLTGTEPKRRLRHRRSPLCFWLSQGDRMAAV
ncbi:hypothetical protein OH77DRAFT_1425429 [Trametes cingulata]|nr:hypothetical protein OH77DRAFT_1425429 [Trametes cingulata]